MVRTGRGRRGLVLVVGLLPLGVVLAHRTRPPIVAVGFAADGRSLATADARWSSPREPPRIEVRVWDLASRRERPADRRVLDGVRLVIEGADRLVARESTGRAIPLTDLTRWPLSILLQGRPSRVFGSEAVASHDGRYLATARHEADDSDALTVRLWDGATGRLLRTLDSAGRVDALAWSGDGRTLAAAGGTLSAWDVASGQGLPWGRGTSPAFAPIAFAPDAPTLVVQAGGSQVQCLDPATGRVLSSVSCLQADALALSRDGSRLALADDMGRQLVTLCDATTGRSVLTFNGHDPIDPRLVTTRNEVSCALWELRSRTGVNLYPLVGSAANFARWSILDVAFHPDGQRIASADYGGSAFVWDATGGGEVARFDHSAGASWSSLGLAVVWAGTSVVAAVRQRQRPARAIIAPRPVDTPEVP